MKPRKIPPCKTCRNREQLPHEDPCQDCLEKNNWQGYEETDVSCTNCKYFSVRTIEEPCRRCKKAYFYGNPLYETAPLNWEPAEEPSQEEAAPPRQDAVNHPSHYTSSGSIECIAAIESMISSMDGCAGFYTGQVLKYIWRHQLKAKPLEDLKKAKWYLEKLIAITEREEENA